MMNSNVKKNCIKVLFSIALLVAYALLVGFYAHYIKMAHGIGESLIVTVVFAAAYLLYILFNKYIGSKIISRSTIEAINISIALLWAVIIISTLAFENHLF